MAKAQDDFKNITESEITTILAEDIKFTGTIEFKSSLMIKGTFNGDVIAEGILLVGPNAKIHGNITTHTLVCHGNIEGNIKASKNIVFCTTSKHIGDLETPNLVIESGATFNGKAVMNTKAQPAAHHSDKKEK